MNRRIPWTRLWVVGFPLAACMTNNTWADGHDSRGPRLSRVAERKEGHRGGYGVDRIEEVIRDRSRAAPHPTRLLLVACAPAGVEGETGKNFLGWVLHVGETGRERRDRAFSFYFCLSGSHTQVTHGGRVRNVQKTSR